MATRQESAAEQLTWVGAEVLRRNWAWYVALGVVLLLLGAVAVAWSSAATIASVVVFGWLLMAGGVLQAIHGEELARPWREVWLEKALLLIAPVLVGAYFVILWTLSGQTVGKWLLGLRVVSAKGARVSLTRALLRLGGYIVSSIPFYAGYLWILFDPQRRALHDRIAGTYVVYTRPRAPRTESWRADAAAPSREVSRREGAGAAPSRSAPRPRRA